MIYESATDGLSQPVRRLGYLETIMCLMHDCINGTTQAVQLLQITGRYEFSFVVEAARLLFEHYELLQCKIKKIDGDFYLDKTVDFGQIEIKQVVLENDKNAWKPLLKAATDVPLSASHSLWRLLAIEGPAADEHRIVVTCHHSIIDNEGMYVIATQFLTYLDALLSKKTIADNKVERVPPAIDNFLRSRTTVRDTEPPHWQMPYIKPIPLEHRSTGCVHGHLGANEHRRLQTFCGRERINIHSILGAALCFATVEAGLAQSPVHFKTAVSLRVFAPMLGHSTSQLGCYISVADTPIVTRGKDLLDAAAEYESSLLKYIVERCLEKRNVNTESLRTMIDKLKENDCFAQGVGVTNLGEVKVPTEFENFYLEDYVPIVNRVAGNYVFVLHVHIFRGTMFFTFVYADPLVDKDTIKKVRDVFLARLASVVGTEVRFV